MGVNSRLFWICMSLIAAAMIFVYTVTATPQQPEPRTGDYTVVVTWLDSTTTIVSSDHVYIKGGWLAIHVTQEPVGMLFIPSLSVSYVSALDNPPAAANKEVLSVEK